jgi:hypothetical protein
MIKLKPLYTSHPVVILICGLCLAQVIGTIQVYLSNLALHNMLSNINSAGYLAVPNRLVMSGLRDFAPAFWGGLFFTCTIGAGISIAAMAASWLWVCIFMRSRPAFIFFLLVWLGLMVAVNSRGFNPMPTLYFLVIAPMVFALTAKREFADFQSDRKRLLVNLIPLPLLALAWFTQFDNEMFLDLRDSLLLSNLYGRKFSNFYYSYTLYPAEAFKALNQKILKTSAFEEINDRSIQLKLSRKLIDSDYLPLDNTTAVDVLIHRRDDHLSLEADGREILRTSINQFLTNPRRILKGYSEKTDRQAKFRQLTFLSILIGFPILIYTFLHAAFYYPGRFITGRKPALLTASIICLLLGVMVLVYFQSNRSSSIRIQNITQALRSDRWQIRLAALKIIQHKKLDIADYAEYQHLMNSGLPQERYWLAKTLAYSRQPETFDDLLRLMQDQNLNVRTMALYSLGLRKDPRAIRPILNMIEISKEWYCQMYAYKALRSLGWKQTKSP